MCPSWVELKVASSLDGMPTLPLGTVFWILIKSSRAVPAGEGDACGVLNVSATALHGMFYVGCKCCLLS